MSQQACEAFYHFLDLNPAVREEALHLKDRFQDQEVLIEAFVRLAARENFHFTAEDLAAYLYRRAEEVRQA